MKKITQEKEFKSDVGVELDTTYKSPQFEKESLLLKQQLSKMKGVHVYVFDDVDDAKTMSQHENMRNYNILSVLVEVKQFEDKTIAAKNKMQVHVHISCILHYVCIL